MHVSRHTTPFQIKVGCDGPSIHVYKGVYREPSVGTDTYVNKLYRDGLTFWMGGNKEILFTFKFIEK
mgnify:CR=1 FL=1